MYQYIYVYIYILCTYLYNKCHLCMCVYIYCTFDLSLLCRGLLPWPGAIAGMASRRGCRRGGFDSHGGSPVLDGLAWNIL